MSCGFFTRHGEKKKKRRGVLSFIIRLFFRVCPRVSDRQNDDDDDDDLKEGAREDEASGRRGAKDFAFGWNGRCDEEESEEEPRVVEFTREHTREHKKDERTTVTTTTPRVEREDGRKTTATHRAELADDSTGTSVGTKEEI